MADDLKDVRPGDSEDIRATAWNTLMDMARAWRAGQIPRIDRTNTPYAGPGAVVAFRITAKTDVTADKKWKYTMTEQVAKASSATGDGYEDKKCGMKDVEGYNVAEERNDVSGEYGGYYGNGVKITDMPAGFKLQPIPIGRVVYAWREPTEKGYEWRFDRDNGVSGTC